jgi:replicative DNA helicase
MSNKLSEYGYSFQIKILTCLFTDKAFLQQIIDILESKFFENDANKFIVDIVKEYFNEFKSPPTKEVLKVKVTEIDNDVLKKTVIEHLKDVYRYIGAEDLDFVKQQTLDFCKNQNLKGAIIKSVELLKDGEYESIKTLIDTAMKAGAERDLGHEYMDNIDERYSESVRNTCTTGWEVIDELSDGGLGKGELGVMVAPAGIGKSWALVNVAANAVKAGKTVLHYTLELNEAYVGLRYDSVFTGIAAQNLKYNIDDVKEKLKSIKGNLVVKYYPTKGASVNTISAHIEKARMQGINPDLVIVDYADLLRGTGKTNELRIQLGNIYEDLRGLAGEQEIPVWTASQANRSALQEDVIQADKIAESYSKIMTADFVVSLSRKIEDKVDGTGRWHVIKNRFGPDGITLPSKMNASNGHIEIFAQSSVQGREVQKQMDNHEETTRKLLKNKFNELNENPS